MNDPIRTALERLIELNEECTEEQWTDAIAAARAALASDGPAVPKSREPASVVGESIDDAELDELFTEIDGSGEPLSWRAYARAVLARWGHQPAPVPVSERLPGAEDCTAQGWCWVSYRGFAVWSLEPPLGQDGKHTGYTHWLPAHALPTPEATDD